MGSVARRGARKNGSSSRRYYTHRKASAASLSSFKRVAASMDRYTRTRFIWQLATSRRRVLDSPCVGIRRSPEGDDRL